MDIFSISETELWLRLMAIRVDEEYLLFFGFKLSKREECLGRRKKGLTEHFLSQLR